MVMEKRPPPTTEQRKAPSTFYKETLREDGTTVRERFEGNKYGIPTTTELTVVTRDGKRQDLFEFFDRRTTSLISARRVLQSIKEVGRLGHPTGVDILDPQMTAFLESQLKNRQFSIFSMIPKKEGESPEIVIVYPDPSKSGDIVDFLHEEGHIRKSAQPEFRKRENSLREQIAKEMHEFAVDLLNGSRTLQKTLSEDEIAISTELLSKNGLIPKPMVSFFAESFGCRKLVLSEGLAKNIYQFFAEEERSASAFALNTIRKLRSQGIDLEPDLDLDGLKERTYGALRTYERSSPFEEEFFTKGRDLGFERLARLRGKSLPRERELLNLVRLFTGRKPLSAKEFFRRKGKVIFELTKRESRRKAGKR